MPIIKQEAVDETFQVRVTDLHPASQGPQQCISYVSGLKTTSNQWHVCSVLTIEEARAQKIFMREQYNPEQFKLDIVKVKLTTIREEEVIE